MAIRTLLLTVLGLAAAVPAGLVVAEDAKQDGASPAQSAPAETSPGGRSEQPTDTRDCVWVGGHFERRESRRVLPAVVRKEWVPDRCEEIVTPAVTERVVVPAVTETVHVPRVIERRWVPEVRERTWVPPHVEIQLDAKGCEVRVRISGHYETRIVRQGAFEDRVVREAHDEIRIVVPERCEVRVVTPERRETRVIEPGHFREVVVRPERTEVLVERTWVPGHWESSHRGA